MGLCSTDDRIGMAETEVAIGIGIVVEVDVEVEVGGVLNVDCTDDVVTVNCVEGVESIESAERVVSARILVVGTVLTVLCSIIKLLVVAASLVLVARTWSGEEMLNDVDAEVSVVVVDEEVWPRMEHIFLNSTRVAMVTFSMNLMEFER
jgi:hypothetical protein